MKRSQILYVFLITLSVFNILPAHAELKLQYVVNPVRSRLPGTTLNSGATIEVKVNKNKDAFIVTKTFFGPLSEGDQLRFEDCSIIMMYTTASKTLGYMIRAPVYDHQVQLGKTIPVKNMDALVRYPTPKSDSRYVMSIGFGKNRKRWGFAFQTVGEDMFLMQDGKVYTMASIVGNLDKHEPHVWIPYPLSSQARSFYSLLKKEIKYKQKYLRIKQSKNIEKRIYGLWGYIQPSAAKPSYSAGRDWSYTYDAIQSIGKSGTEGTAFLRNHYKDKKLSPYIYFVLDAQKSAKDKIAVPWIQANINKAIDQSRSLRWPLKYCDSKKLAQRHTVIFLCYGASNLAALKDKSANPEIRKSIAWNLAQGRSWWVSVEPFTLYASRQSHKFTSHPVPETDPLIRMTMDISSCPDILRHELTPKTMKCLEKLMPAWRNKYNKQAVPALLWALAMKYQSCSNKQHQEKFVEQAHKHLVQLVGKDLGKNGLPYWIWYIDHVLMIKRKNRVSSRRMR